MKWQPIEIAPKDGEPFLGWIDWGDEGEILRMRWFEEAQRFGDATYDPFIDDREQPTLWQPLPAPPLKDKE